MLAEKFFSLSETLFSRATARPSIYPKVVNRRGLCRSFCRPHAASVSACISMRSIMPEKGVALSLTDPAPMGMLMATGLPAKPSPLSGNRSLSARLFARPQSNRNGILETQSCPAPRRQTNSEGTLATDR